MLVDRIVATIVASLILIFAGATVWRNEPFADPNLVMVLRVMLSLGTAVLGATIPGFLNLSWSGRGLIVRAGGALALFVLTFMYTPYVFRNDQLSTDRIDINQKNVNADNVAVGKVTVVAPAK